MSLLNANTLLVASIVGVSGISSMLLSGIFSWGTKEKRMEDQAREPDLQLSSIYAMIRSANSWDQLIREMNALGYVLYPAKGDIFAVNLTSRRVVLSDSGHNIPFIIERLGMPPEDIAPKPNDRTRPFN